MGRNGVMGLWGLLGLVGLKGLMARGVAILRTATAFVLSYCAAVLYSKA